MTTKQPRVLPGDSMVPPFPIGGLKDFKQTEMYLRRLANALKADRGQVGNRVERRILHGPAAERPTADGGGNVYYSTDTEEYDIDTGTWENVVTSGGISDHGGLSGLDDVNDHPWAIKDTGDTMGGELVMSGGSSYITQYWGAPGIRYGNDPYYNLIRGEALNAVWVGDYSLALAFFGLNTRPHYKGVEMALLSDTSDTFLELDDVSETDYTSFEGYGVGVNDTPDGLEFIRFVKVAGDTMTGNLTMGDAEVGGAHLVLVGEPGAGPALNSMTLGKDVYDQLRFENNFGYAAIGVESGAEFLEFRSDATVGFWFGDNLVLDNADFQLIAGASPFTVIGVPSSGAIPFGNDSYTTDLRGDTTRPTYKGADLALYSDTGGAPGSDPAAIHDDTEAEISAITAKTTPVGADIVVIEDSAAATTWEKKKLSLTDLANNYLDLVFSVLDHTHLEEDITDLGNYLPKSAGPGNAITGHLYINGYDLYFENTYGIALWNAAKSTAYTGLSLSALELRVGGSTSLTGRWTASAISLDATTVDVTGTLTADTLDDSGAGTITCNTPFFDCTGRLETDEIADSSAGYTSLVNDLYFNKFQSLGFKATAGNRAWASMELIASVDRIMVGNSVTPTVMDYDLYLKDGVGIKGYHSTYVSSGYLIRASGLDLIVGNSVWDTRIYSNADVEFNNNIDMNGYNILTAGGDIQMDYGDKLTIEDSGSAALDMLWVSGTSRIFGNTTGDTWLEGLPLKMFGYGYSGSAAPSTTNWATDGSWGIHIDDGAVFLVYRSGASMKTVELT